MKIKINHGENTKKETGNENIRIISEKKNPNLLIMNKPTLSKMTIKRKPKKIKIIEINLDEKQQKIIF